jgi:hypothetical protein
VGLNIYSKAMSKYLLLIYGIVLGYLPVSAQQSGIEDSVLVNSQTMQDAEYDDEEIVVPDTIVKVREIILSPDSALQWRTRKEFQYIHTIDSILRKSQEVKKTPTRRTNSSGSFMNRVLGGGFIKFLLWSLAILFLLIIIYQLSKSGKLFTGSKRNVQVSEQADEEELLLHHNFDDLISSAIKNEDYRLATRYHFLKVLQQLRDKNHIAFEPDKTNSRYVREVPAALQPAFSTLVLQYEYVWYGHFDIGMEQFQQLEKGFQHFYQKI